MATRTAVKRLTAEYRDIQRSPPPGIEARPDGDNILEWYYVLHGPEDTPFAGGLYMGSLTFPANYPFSPPAIRMLTPSGRFEPGARLCLSMSDYHPESWNPAWSVNTILVGLMSFMCSNEIATGAMNTTNAQKRRYTERSARWNLDNPRFRENFPHLVDQLKQQAAQNAATIQEEEDKSPTRVLPKDDKQGGYFWKVAIGALLAAFIIASATRS